MEVAVGEGVEVGGWVGAEVRWATKVPESDERKGLVTSPLILPPICPPSLLIAPSKITVAL